MGIVTICESLSLKTRWSKRSRFLFLLFLIEMVCQKILWRLNSPVRNNLVSLLNCCKTNLERLRRKEIFEPGGLYTVNTEDEVIFLVTLQQTDSAALQSSRIEYFRSFLIRIATPQQLPFPSFRKSKYEDKFRCHLFLASARFSLSLYVAYVQ